MVTFEYLNEDNSVVGVSASSDYSGLHSITGEQYFISEGRHSVPQSHRFWLLWDIENQNVEEWHGNIAPTPEEIALSNTALSRQAVDAYIGADFDLDGALYQMDSDSYVHISTAIGIAERNGEDDTATREWRLADNTWRTTSLAELKQLRTEHDTRFEHAWNAFYVWDSGSVEDKQTVIVL